MVRVKVVDDTFHSMSAFGTGMTSADALCSVPSPAIHTLANRSTCLAMPSRVARRTFGSSALHCNGGVGRLGHFFSLGQSRSLQYQRMAGPMGVVERRTRTVSCESTSTVKESVKVPRSLW